MKDMVIVGIGNTIRCDDGIGIYVARRIKTLFAKQAIDIKEAHSGGLDILHMLSGYRRAVVIDAIQQKGAKPGEFIRLTQDELLSVRPLYSSHKLGIYSALRIAQALGMDMPEQIIIYAIYAQRTACFGKLMSPKMRKAVKKIAALVRKEKILWQ
ncbi:MAG: hydrogenase maturation protease [Candidatus Omnitrophica bacterium]|nr:hydrogenase maturation protease [Candidatus Omnitrophota bacterium]